LEECTEKGCEFELTEKQKNQPKLNPPSKSPLEEKRYIFMGISTCPSCKEWKKVLKEKGLTKKFKFLSEQSDDKDLEEFVNLDAKFDIKAFPKVIVDEEKVCDLAGNEKIKLECDDEVINL